MAAHITSIAGRAKILVTGSLVAVVVVVVAIQWDLITGILLMSYGGWVKHFCLHCHSTRRHKLLQ